MTPVPCDALACPHDAMEQTLTVAHQRRRLCADHFDAFLEQAVEEGRAVTVEVSGHVTVDWSDE